MLSSSARKGDGEGGILFDNEDEKEQWEEDQKVSGLLDAIHALVTGVFVLTFLTVSEWFAASRQRLVHDGRRLWWVPQPFHDDLWWIYKEEGADSSETDSEKNLCPETTDKWGNYWAWAGYVGSLYVHLSWLHMHQCWSSVFL